MLRKYSHPFKVKIDTSTCWLQNEVKKPFKDRHFYLISVTHSKKEKQGIRVGEIVAGSYWSSELQSTDWMSVMLSPFSMIRPI
jgi:hypothetical protein